MSIDIATDELVARWIELNPHKPGPAEARVRGYGVAVWALIGQMALERGDDSPRGYAEVLADAGGEKLAGKVAAYYQIPFDAVLAALAYFSRHRAEITAKLTLNRAAFAG